MLLCTRYYTWLLYTRYYISLYHLSGERNWILIYKQTTERKLILWLCRKRYRFLVENKKYPKYILNM